MIAPFLVFALLAFDPVATLDALGRVEARGPTLTGLLSLGVLDLKKARTAKISTAVASVVADSTVPFEERVAGTRALALLGGDAGVKTLGALLEGDTPQANALALEAARALRQLKAVEALVPALKHGDPQVRAMAAGAGVGGPALCGLLDDPWPAVKKAAVAGLAMNRAHAGCLAGVLTSTDAVIGVLAARSAGESGQTSLIAPLRTLAGNPKMPVAARAEALVALGRLGDPKPAHTVMKTHLDQGKIEPLALGAARALVWDVSADGTGLLRRALGSKSGPVRLLAVEALAVRGDTESIKAIKALREGFPLRQRADVDRALERLGQAVGPDDPALSDPE